MYTQNLALNIVDLIVEIVIDNGEILSSNSSLIYFIPNNKIGVNIGI